MAVLEEYKSLRSEAVTARDAQLSILRLSIPLLAAVIGLGVTLREESFIGAILLSAVVPVLVFLTFELWIGEAQRSVRAGSVVAAIERRLADLFDGNGLGPPMGWERWLRKPADKGRRSIAKQSQQQRDSSIRVSVISLLLLMLAGGSAGLGLHFLQHNGYETAFSINLALLLFVLLALIVRVAVAVHGLRKRDFPPGSEEIWPIPP